MPKSLFSAVFTFKVVTTLSYYKSTGGPQNVDCGLFIPLVLLCITSLQIGGERAVAASIKHNPNLKGTKVQLSFSLLVCEIKKESYRLLTIL